MFPSRKKRAKNPDSQFDSSLQAPSVNDYQLLHYLCKSDQTKMRAFFGRNEDNEDVSLTKDNQKKISLLSEAPLISTFYLRNLIRHFIQLNQINPRKYALIHALGKLLNCIIPSIENPEAFEMTYTKSLNDFNLMAQLLDTFDQQCATLNVDKETILITGFEFMDLPAAIQEFILKRIKRNNYDNLIKGLQKKLKEYVESKNNLDHEIKNLEDLDYKKLIEKLKEFTSTSLQKMDFHNASFQLKTAFSVLVKEYNTNFSLLITEITSVESGLAAHTKYSSVLKNFPPLLPIWDDDSTILIDKNAAEKLNSKITEISSSSPSKQNEHPLIKALRILFDEVWSNKIKLIEEAMLDWYAEKLNIDCLKEINRLKTLFYKIKGTLGYGPNDLIRWSNPRTENPYLQAAHEFSKSENQNGESSSASSSSGSPVSFLHASHSLSSGLSYNLPPGLDLTRVNSQRDEINRVRQRQSINLAKITRTQSAPNPDQGESSHTPHKPYTPT